MNMFWYTGELPCFFGSRAFLYFSKYSDVDDVDFQKNFVFSGAGLFFGFGEYSDVDEADFRKAFYLLRNNNDETVRS